LEHFQTKETAMTDNTSELAHLVETLRKERDELRVKLHLAKSDVRDEWEKVEHKWQQVEVKLPQVKSELGSAAGNVGAALALAVDEIQAAYRRIRKLF